MAQKELTGRARLPGVMAKALEAGTKGDCLTFDDVRSRLHIDDATTLKLWAGAEETRSHRRGMSQRYGQTLCDARHQDRPHEEAVNVLLWSFVKLCRPLVWICATACLAGTSASLAADPRLRCPPGFKPSDQVCERVAKRHPAPKETVERPAAPSNATTEQQQIIDRAQSPGELRRRAEAEQREKDDLEAQQRMADATSAIETLTLLQVILGVAGTGALIWTLVYTGKAINLANKEFIASHRPRLVVRYVSEGRRATATGDVPIYFVTVANTGDTEATITGVGADAGLRDSTTKQWIGPGLYTFAGAARAAAARSNFARR